MRLEKSSGPLRLRNRAARPPSRIFIGSRLAANRDQRFDKNPRAENFSTVGLAENSSTFRERLEFRDRPIHLHGGWPDGGLALEFGDWPEYPTVDADEGANPN